MQSRTIEERTRGAAARGMDVTGVVDMMQRRGRSLERRLNTMDSLGVSSRCILLWIFSHVVVNIFAHPICLLLSLTHTLTHSLCSSFPPLVCLCLCVGVGVHI